jgi:hypothetical protein
MDESIKYLLLFALGAIIAYAILKGKW